MNGNKFSLDNMPAEGLNAVFDEQSVWEGPIAEFKMGVRVVEPLKLEVFILPGGDGYLLRGRLHGKVALPCDRCAEEAVVNINHDFENFEPTPELAADGKYAAESDAGLISAEDGSLVLDTGALGWEEFILSLPVKPLCGADCRGLCPICGANLNNVACNCKKREEDPRLAPLRGVIVKH